MRVDKDDPGQVYEDFWDWVRTGWHAIMLISLFFAYLYYLATTEEA